ncbi:hypothetical protein [Rhabdochlamydiaceae symbiont of Dictyostelium giganteum]|uniref:hypothetical protein n=1 Tax=Rhabdochlamydiaceae symbiont of Dictyostelium giganteum TaxID=3342349 RepID=UPI00384DF31E
MIISPVSEHGLARLKLINIPLLKENLFCEDRAYINYGWKENLLQEKGIKLGSREEKNSKRHHPKEIEQDKREARNLIETAISGVVYLMLRWFKLLQREALNLN